MLKLATWKSEFLAEHHSEGSLFALGEGSLSTHRHLGKSSFEKTITGGARKRCRHKVRRLTLG